MPRPLRRDIDRPDCPLGHRGGRVWLDGRYAAGSGAFERTRFACVPPKGGDWKRHVIWPELPRRRPTARHPCGGGCHDCDRPFRQGEGVETARRFVYTAREAARTLVAVGRGLSYREASRATRTDALRVRVDVHDQGWASRNASLAADYIDQFADTVAEALLPDRWPPIVVLDALEVRRRATADGVSLGRGGRNAFVVFAAHGYRTDRSRGELWRLGLGGAKDRGSWEEFLRELPAQPSPTWVVCDDDEAIKMAVRRAWPAATIHLCDLHLARTAREHLGADPRAARLIDLVYQALDGAEGWDALVAAASTDPASTPAFRAWVVAKWPDMGARATEGRVGVPRATGAIEGLLGRLDQAIGARRRNFRNAGRLRRLLRLMVLHYRGLDDERVYTLLLKAALRREGGHPLLHGRDRWRDRCDRREEPSSLRVLVATAQAHGRRAKKQRKNLRYRDRIWALVEDQRLAAGLTPRARRTRLPREPTP